MILGVEGLDGAGKTSVAFAVAERLGALAVRVPPSELTLVDSEILGDYAAAERYAYYLAGVLRIESKYGRTPDVVVVDRYVASAHAMHSEVPGDAAEHLRQTPVPSAHFSVLLAVDEDERRRRLRSRGLPLDPYELRLSQDSGFRGSALRVLEEWRHDLRVDTTSLSVTEVVDVICSAWVDARDSGPAE